jgi:putative FmdB family regulatory protein
MPIYAYRCDDCGHELEALQKISESPLTDCPKCGHSSLKKQVTAAGFQLKGSGWYQTDFRGGGKPSASSSSTTPKPSSAEAKSNAQSESQSGTASDKSATPSCGAGCACCH